MIRALRKSGDSHAAHDPCAFYGKRKRSAMGGEFVVGNPRASSECSSYSNQAHAIGAAMEPRDGIALALHP